MSELKKKKRHVIAKLFKIFKFKQGLRYVHFIAWRVHFYIFNCWAFIVRLPPVREKAVVPTLYFTSDGIPIKYSRRDARI